MIPPLQNQRTMVHKSKKFAAAVAVALFVGALSVRVDTQGPSVGTVLDARFTDMLAQFAQVEFKRAAALEARTDAIESRVNQLDSAYKDLAARVRVLEQQVQQPAPCQFTAWAFSSAGPWSACVNGQQTRTETWTRTIVSGPSTCGPLSEQRTGTQACAPPPPPLRASVSVVTAGPFTAGLALPAGVASAGLQVGSFATQTDVKTRWPDGSIRHAIVSANATRTGTFQVTASSVQTGMVGNALPSARVTLAIGGRNYVADLPTNVLGSLWLDGPIVREGRAKVIPVNGGTPHAGLEVLFDIRSYASGGHRVDVAVQNIKNLATTTRVSYTASVTVNGSQVMAPTSLSHAAMMRWRRVFTVDSLGSARSGVASFQAAKAIPSYTLTSVNTPTYSLTDPRMNILQSGCSPAEMGQAGGRPDLAPYPEWVAVYAITGRVDAYNYMLKCGDLAGGWSAHLTEPNGALFTIDAHPNFWVFANPPDVGSPADEKLAIEHRHIGGCDSCWHWPQVPDNAHAPSLALVPYLLTGDRYYADEMMHWANFAMLRVHGPPRGGALGHIWDQMRGQAWALRNLVDAAIWLPDTHPNKTYFTQKVNNNLTNFDATADSAPGPLHSWGEQGETPWPAPGVAVMAPWQNGYMAWALNHARRQGFTAGLRLLDRTARFQMGLYGWNPGESGAYYLPFNENGTWYPDYATMRAKTLQFNGNNLGELSAITVYAPDIRFALLAAQVRGMAGATAALQWIEAQGYTRSAFASRPAYAISAAGVQ